MNNKKTYFEDNNFKLYQGDCLVVLQQFPDNYFDMIFADPPYNLSNGGFSVHAGRRVSVNKGTWDKSNGLESDFNFQLSWITECYRVLKPGGTIWISGTYHSIYQCGFALQLNKFKILNDISWYKPNATPNLSCRYFTASHETLVWAKKGTDKDKHYFNYKLMREGSWLEDKFKVPGKQMRSVWALNTPKPWEKVFGKHPTQKPFDLLKRIVLASTKKGDKILDPFTGSSTTGLAAIKFDRKFVGIDLEKEYLNLSVKRYKESEKQEVSV